MNNYNQRPECRNGHILCFLLMAIILFFVSGCTTMRSGGILDQKSWQHSERIFDQVFHALQKYKVHGGYLSIYDVISGEGFDLGLQDKVVDGDIKIAYNGTTDVLVRYLEYYKRNGGEELLAEIIDITDVILSTQNSYGGWGYWGMMKPNSSKRRGMATESIKMLTSFDEGITPMVIDYLIDLHKTTGNKDYRKAIDRGISVILKSQNSDGGWPQYYPASEIEYGQYSSLNDATSNMCFRTLLKYREEEGPMEVDSAIVRYNEFLLSRQSRFGAWAQQYDHSGKPASARGNEPAALCSFCTGQALEDLIGMHTLSITKQLRKRNKLAMESAEVWLSRSKLSNSQWARYYDLDSNKPFFVDYQGQRYNNLSAAQSNHQAFRGYAYMGYFDIPNLLAKLQGWRNSRFTTIADYLASQGYTSDYKIIQAKALIDEVSEKRMLDPVLNLRDKRYWHLYDALRVLDYINASQAYLLDK